jgi:hypothetical protein
MLFERPEVRRISNAYIVYISDLINQLVDRHSFVLNAGELGLTCNSLTGN